MITLIQYQLPIRTPNMRLQIVSIMNINFDLVWTLNDDAKQPIFVGETISPKTK